MLMSSDGRHERSSTFESRHTPSAVAGSAGHVRAQKSVGAPIWRAAKHAMGWPRSSVPHAGSVAAVSHEKTRLSKAARSTLHPEPAIPATRTTSKAEIPEGPTRQPTLENGGERRRGGRTKLLS